MKKILITITLVFSCLFVYAQGNGYRFTYEEKAMMKASDFKIEDPAMKEMIMKALNERKQFYTLTFSDGKSLFEMNKELSSESFGMEGRVVYTDINKGISITQEELYGKKFLVADTLNKIQWQITDETKEINGRMCTKAVAMDSAQQEGITAWFSFEIPVPAGPMGIVGLPGLIVQLDIAVLSYTLTNVEVVNDVKEINPPKKGKKMDREEFQKLQNKMIEEMKARHPRGEEGIQIITM
ncbi:MAG: GLPGLI family protein [Bacteroidales bacterium]|nr:GLPGLI family protein [Bacteroidales bacterium]